MIWSALCSIAGVLWFPFPSIIAIKWAHVWAYGIKLLLKYVVGITYEVVGIENLPKGESVIIASKHQSAFETAIYHLVFSRAVFVLKKELLYLPFFGWNLMKCGAIALDRKAGTAAMRKMLKEVEDRKKLGRQIIIFPEGTRTAYGKRVTEYKPGVALLYEKCDLKVLPVAINSGKFWKRNSILQRHPGKITIKIMPPMPAGMDKKAFMSALNTTIEDAVEKL